MKVAKAIQLTIDLQQKIDDVTPSIILLSKERDGAPRSKSKV